ncbi:hypothetical protein BCR34DRAFT_198763 [Clohesyomyces aquaticus]|uniref:Uncharacterized protein n=1 Tax=Clohesyomyces aquaticus TaxID=1231657 RepID=A0A1Y1ZZ66_9PLEO|nr:hypothetical protein BCR34DRAFT_198763 [Clohesyomyces aquaticus]
MGPIIFSHLHTSSRKEDSVSSLASSNSPVYGHGYAASSDQRAQVIPNLSSVQDKTRSSLSSSQEHGSYKTPVAICLISGKALSARWVAATRNASEVVCGLYMSLVEIYEGGIASVRWVARPRGQPPLPNDPHRGKVAVQPCRPGGYEGVARRMGGRKRAGDPGR